MQIRHSYSIGSIVPFSSSTTFTTTGKNKDSSKCTHILQAWPTFPALQVQFSESHWNVEIFSIWGFQTKCFEFVCVQDGQQLSLTALVVSLCPPLQDIHLMLYTFCNNRNHSSLILTVSPTSNTLTAVKTQPLAWSRLQAFAVFLRDFQGTEMFFL